MLTWQQTLIAAQPWVNFLERHTFFDTPYTNTLDAHVITDAQLGIDYATNDTFTHFDEWQTVTNAPEIFPEHFIWSEQITRQLSKNRYWDLQNKHFCGATDQWNTETSCPLIELMYRDIEIIFQCYANHYFPNIWQDILTAYLHNGFPCGWSAHRPQGKLVVFSNLLPVAN